jgi:hypothetical protein
MLFDTYRPFVHSSSLSSSRPSMRSFSHLHRLRKASLFTRWHERHLLTYRGGPAPTVAYFASVSHHSL